MEEATPFYCKNMPEGPDLSPFCIKDILGHAKFVGCYFPDPSHNGKLSTKGHKTWVIENFHF